LAVIPARNEAPRIAPVVTGALKHVDAAIVVDDGSEDGTGEAAAEAGAIVVRHVINLGKGAALKTGCLAARKLGAEAVVFLDADGQHMPGDIPKLTAPLVAGKADIVFGAREMEKGASMPAVLKFGNWFLSASVKALFGVKIRDTQSGFRAFKMDALDKIFWESAGYAVETEIIVRAARAGLKYDEASITTTYLDKYKGTTVFDGLKIFWKLLVWRMS
jgi:glycosyltransferase involved in cell wall biosynthesis